MPVKTACPGCQAPYTLADTMRGKKVRCKQCQDVFTVTDNAELAVEAEAAPTAPPRVRGGAPSPRPARQARPEQLPRRRSEAGPGGAPQSNALLWILLASGGGLALLVGIVVTIVLLARSSGDDDRPVVQNAPPFPGPGPNPMAPGGNFPGMQNPPGQNPLPPGGNIPPGQNPMPAQAPGLIKASSTRFPIEPVDNYGKDVLFAPQARQVGCYYWDPKDIARKLLGLYDIATGQPRGVIDLGTTVSATTLDISPDGSRVAQGENTPFKGNPITVWSAPDGKMLVEKWDPYPADPRQPGLNFERQLVWFALLDRDRLLTVTRSGQYDLWDMAQKQRGIYSVPAGMGPQRSLDYDGFSRRPRNIALSVDRKVLALSNKNGFDLIDAATGKLLRSTQGLDFKGKVGNEWSVAFSPDGAQLAAKLNLAAPNNPGKLVNYLVVWDVATGQQKSLFPMAQNFSANGPLIWWGPRHLLLCNGIVTDARLFSLADGRFWRVCQRGGHGRLASDSPDSKLWCVTSLLGIQRAEVSAVELPADQLQQPPAGPGEPPLPEWFIRPDGVATARANRF